MALAAGAQAAGDKTVYEQAQATAKAQYDTARKQCDSLSGNAKDVCVTEAKATRTTAEARAKASYEGTPKAQQKAAEDVARAEYSVAKERCDERSGNAEDVCEKDAKAAYERAKAEARLDKTVGEARQEAVEHKREATIDAQAERCDSLAGDAKAACLDRARNPLRD
ncbi:hypothetical protein [Caldimonas mangrovi]|uniref:hypothetical protein n=1 Tax=Caldimonas mangrovi TaxID=2944811 RepID=UPI00204471F2|nr:hypothetical protein [Caldimonas mangrovi]